MRWLRHLGNGGRDVGLSIAESAFAGITDENITDETITDEQTLRGALASRAKQYYHTPDAAPDRDSGGPGARAGGGDDEHGDH
jgi:hypothetical protein